MKTILLPTDFSETSEKALEFAIQIAKYTNAEIVVTNSFYIPVGQQSLPAQSLQGIYSEGEERARINMEIICAKIDAMVSFSGDKLTSSYIYKYALPGSEIIQVALQKKADLIIMGTNLQESILGTFVSKTMEVIDNAPCPVLVVNKRLKVGKFHHVHLALENVHRDLYAVNHLVKILKGFEPDITVIHASENPYDPDRMAQCEDAIIEKMTVIKGFVKYGKMKYKFIDCLQENEGLMEYVKAHGSDLIALLKQERSWINDLFHHSFIKYFLKNATCPLLILPKNSSET